MGFCSTGILFWLLFTVSSSYHFLKKATSLTIILAGGDSGINPTFSIFFFVQTTKFLDRIGNKILTVGTFSMPTSYQYSGCEKERRILIGPW